MLSRLGDLLASLFVSETPSTGSDEPLDPAASSAAAPEGIAEGAWADAEWNDDTVVLVDESGRATGTGAKSQIHHESTPLHLAFSCYIFDAQDRFLVTMRARSKPSFPGVVTNSCCGHPRPGEALAEAARRRAGSELGLKLDEIWLVLPEFRYRATSANGLVENEICPVYAARTSSPDLALDRSEVEEAEWVPWQEFAASVLSGEREVSRWCAEQVPQLTALGSTPADWPAADESRLPAAARQA
ncbi:MAG: isopentenyl-diphosphate Delta-isomerase [Actinomycetales bacterium]|nr:isopentenyl-diphosphate Delta-isomerase [Tetrasphaera sp.]NLW99166.1 isopentenyl-diphosphate Delta-isomerase [Actinomycetales bacterium]